MASATPRVLALVPVYNHAGTLRQVVEGLLAEGLPVLVVDDGSTDGALERITDLPVRWLRLPVNRGKGAAILAGASVAEAAGFDAVLTIDADGQHDPRDAKLLLEGVTGADWPCIVVGCRQMTGAFIPRSSHFGRAFSNFWVRIETGRSLKDTQSGYRLYPTVCLRESTYLSRRYTFEIEVLVRSAWAGVPILDRDVSVLYLPGKARISHFRAFRDNWRLSLLHAWLVTLSLLPWTRRKGLEAGTGASPREALLHPLRFLRRIALEHATPPELAVAVGMGVWIGSLPIIPFGLATIVYVHHRLHLNKLAGVGASNLCIAPFVPFLCIQVGHLLRHGRWWTDFSRQSLLSEIHWRLWEWLLGSLVVGPLLGLIVALPVYGLVKWYQARFRT